MPHKVVFVFHDLNEGWILNLSCKWHALADLSNQTKENIEAPSKKMLNACFHIKKSAAGLVFNLLSR